MKHNKYSSHAGKAKQDDVYHKYFGCEEGQDNVEDFFERGPVDSFISEKPQASYPVVANDGTFMEQFRRAEVQRPERAHPARDMRKSDSSSKQTKKRSREHSSTEKTYVYHEDSSSRRRHSRDRTSRRRSKDNIWRPSKDCYESSPEPPEPTASVYHRVSAEQLTSDSDKDLAKAEAARAEAALRATYEMTPKELAKDLPALQKGTQAQNTLSALHNASPSDKAAIEAQIRRAAGSKRFKNRFKQQEKKPERDAKSSDGSAYLKMVEELSAKDKMSDNDRGKWLVR